MYNIYIYILILEKNCIFFYETFSQVFQNDIIFFIYFVFDLILQIFNLQIYAFSQIHKYCT